MSLTTGTLSDWLVIPGRENQPLSNIWTDWWKQPAVRFILMAWIFMIKILIWKCCVVKSDWYSSTRNISCLKQTFLKTSASDQRIWDCRKWKWNCVHLKRCVLSGWMKICITSRRLIYRVDRKDVLRLPVCLRCARMCWYWTNRQQVWTRRAEMKF